MKIDPKNSIDAIYESNVRKSPAPAENNVDQNKQLGKDRVEISKAASDYNEVSALKAEAVRQVEKGTPTEKLRQLKAAIESGTYHVDSKDIAGAMIDRLKQK